MIAPRPRRLHGLLVCCVFLVITAALARPAAASFVAPNLIPVDRLVRNLTQYTREHPEDAQGYYVLGRVHYFAWALKSDAVPAIQRGRDDELPRFPAWESGGRVDPGILVWDPDGAGRITSGRQLFGSVTFWMFWRDGYAALDALDDDRDGELAGEELRGLAVWFDRDGNGVSQPGEVVPVDRLGVEAIAARATSRADDAERSPSNPAGVRLRGGRAVPSYDWSLRAK